MKITFLGTGTSMGVPVAGGFLRDQLSHDPRNDRSRCSAWIQTTNQSILIDAGPEFRVQSIKAQIQHIDSVLITHQHMDHMAGLDDLRVYSYKSNSAIPVYATKRCLQSIATRFNYLFGKDKYPGSASLNLIEVSEESFSLGNIEVTPLPVKHGNMDILGYRLNDFSYLTDVKSIPEETLKKIKGSKVVVLSALRWKPDHPTHLTIPEAVEIIQKLDVPQAYLIHMNSYVDHDPANKKLPENIKLAYDQQVIEIE